MDRTPVEFSFKMMRHILFAVIMVLCNARLSAQQEDIEDPSAGFISSDVHLHVDKVFYRYSLVFTEKYKVGSHLNIPKQASIQPLGGPEKYDSIYKRRIKQRRLELFKGIV